MNEAGPKLWLGIRRKTVLAVAGAIVGINLLWGGLAFSSTTPYIWSWTSHAGTVRVMRFYWDGRAEFEEYPRTGWTVLAEGAIWSVLLVAILGAGYLAVRWLNHPGRPPISLRKLSAWAFAAAIVVTAAAVLAAFSER